MAKKRGLVYLKMEHVETICWELAGNLFDREGYCLPKALEYHDKNRLLFAVDAPQWKYYKNVFEKAGNLGYLIITGHPLRDGNKRCGMASTITFLLLNGYMLDVAKGEVLEIALDVATHKMTKEGFINWLKKNSKKVDLDKIAEKNI